MTPAFIRQWFCLACYFSSAICRFSHWTCFCLWIKLLLLELWECASSPIITNTDSNRDCFECLGLDNSWQLWEATLHQHFLWCFQLPFACATCHANSEGDYTTLGRWQSQCLRSHCCQEVRHQPWPTVTSHQSWPLLWANTAPTSNPHAGKLSLWRVLQYIKTQVAWDMAVCSDAMAPIFKTMFCYQLGRLCRALWIKPVPECLPWWIALSQVSEWSADRKLLFPLQCEGWDNLVKCSKWFRIIGSAW